MKKVLSATENQIAAIIDDTKEIDRFLDVPFDRQGEADKINAEINVIIKEFDSEYSPEYRYKEADVSSKWNMRTDKLAFFVTYYTQEDYDGEGAEYFRDALIRANRRTIELYCLYDVRDNMTYDKDISDFVKIEEYYLRSVK